MKQPGFAPAVLGFFCAVRPSLGALGKPEHLASRPNIILCMTDDQSWGDVSSNGLTKIKTPNLDALAAAGRRFNRFYTRQTCSPRRASVPAGRCPNRPGVFWLGMPLQKTS